MAKKFIYLYFMKKEPEKIKESIAEHVNYWQNLNINGYVGGPFSDKTGGLITFEAENFTEASRLIENDPFMQKDLIKDVIRKGWIPE